MTRLSIITASVLTLIALPPLVGTMTSPALAQEHDWSDNDSDMGDGDVRGLVRDWVRDNPDRRDMLMDLLQERRDRRAELMDRMHDRMDMRDRIRDRIASRWEDDDHGGDWRSRLRERIAERRGGGGNCYFLTRSLRDEDGSLLVVVRRRVCRD